MKKIILSVSLIFFSTSLVFADPMQGLDYKKVFDLSAIHKKHAPLMHAIGCADNVFDDNEQGTKTDDEIDIAQALEDYQADCLAHLNSHRRWLVFKTVNSSLLGFMSTAAVAAAVVPVVGIHSLGGSIGMLPAAYTAVNFVQTCAQSAYDLYHIPSHPLDKYEIKFVQNQCFIPKAMWPIILSKFTSARVNTYDQKAALNFLEFTLELTVHRPIGIKAKCPFTPASARKILTTKINNFFENYDEIDQTQLSFIKTNALNFLASLHGEESPKRYLFFVGPGGIGKTHFARKLTEWIDELYPHALHLEELRIDNLMELEGTHKKPGAFLRVLRNQCQAKKKGSVVFFDEAEWMSHGGGIAKRVFNGDQSKLATTYFGEHSAVEDLQIDLPPMLIIVASNGEINDPALKSRFDCIDFPSPQKEALLEEGYRLVQESDLIKTNKKKFTNKKKRLKQEYLSQIDNLLSEATNFRDVQSLIPTLLQEWQEQIWGIARPKAKTDHDSTENQNDDKAEPLETRD